MAEQDTQSSTEAQKTVVAFIAGLVIGGLLVFAFGGTPSEDTSDMDNDLDTSEVRDTDEEDEEDASSEQTDDDSTSTDDTETPSNIIETGDAAARVTDQAAGSVVTIDSATYPNDEGWIGVREYVDGETGSILGVARYSKSQGLTPSQVKLLRATTAGSEYAVVFFTDNGDRSFSSSVDVQVGSVADTFRAE